MNPDCCEKMRQAQETAAKHGMKLVYAKDKVTCGECAGSGEIGLSDGEIPCPKCCGSGDPEKPGPFEYKSSKSKEKCKR